MEPEATTTPTPSQLPELYERSEQAERLKEGIIQIGNALDPDNSLSGEIERSRRELAYWWRR